MFIEEITINGLLSYSREAKLGDLDPQLNVVVGRNGAGKSNFFEAIQFVLGNVNELDLNSLHSFQKSAKCFVEIVISNTDQLIVGFGDRVTVSREHRRGSADTYMIDNAKVTKRDFFSTLETAGLNSDTASFNIVPQGEVHRLATASDLKRLDILLNASGAVVFDKRIKESEKLLSSALEKSTETELLIVKLENMLSRVSEEAKELEKIRETKDEMRSTEYLMLILEKIRTQHTIDSVKSDQTKLNAQVLNQENQLAKLELNEETMTSKIADLEEVCANNELECENIKQQIERLERLAVTSSAGSGIEAPRVLRDQTNQLNGELKQTKRVLEEKTQVLVSLREKLENLQLKQGRSNLQGDELLKHQKHELSRVESRITEISQLIPQESEKLRNLELSLAEKQSERESVIRNLEETNRESQSLKSKVHEATKMQTETEANKSSMIFQMRKDEITLSRLQKSVEQKTKLFAAGNSFSDDVNTISVVKRAVKKLGLQPDEYYGTLAEVLDVKRAAIEVCDRVIGRQYFYHVVNNSATLSKIVKEIGNEVSATFIPVEDLHVKPPPTITSKTSDGEDIIPLRDWVDTVDSEKFGKVRDYLVGRYVVASSLQKAVTASAELNLPAVTMEGDLCDTTGVISGGLSGNLGQGKKKLDAIREFTKVYSEIIELEGSIALAKRAITKTNQQIVQYSNTLNQLQGEYMPMTARREELQAEISELNLWISAAERNIEYSKEVISELQSEINRSKDEYQKISDTDSFASSLNGADRSEINSLKKQIADLTAECKRLSETEIEFLFNKLEMSKEDQETENFQNDSASQELWYRNAEISDASKDPEYQKAQKNLDNAKKKLQQSLKNLDDANTKLSTQQTKSSDARNTLKDLVSKIQRLSHKLTALNMFYDKVDKEIDNIGRVTSAAIETAVEYNNLFTSSNYDPEDIKAEVLRLEKESKNLAKILSASKPLDPKVTGTREALVAELSTLRLRLDNLLEEHKTVLRTLDELKFKKNSKLDQSIIKISQKFSEIFTTISGGHTGELVLHRNGHDEISSVGLNVSFGDTTTNLSGGQRTVCALAIIFAIQSYEPAPFYIFDEIDSNLDTHARTRVAAVIKDISTKRKVQFICTTFYPELVSAASAWFGVTFEHGSSSIEPIDKDTAIEFTTSDT